MQVRFFLKGACLSITLTKLPETHKTTRNKQKELRHFERIKAVHQGRPLATKFQDLQL
jgi:hypothetical protein